MRGPQPPRGGGAGERHPQADRGLSADGTQRYGRRALRETGFHARCRRRRRSMAARCRGIRPPPGSHGDPIVRRAFRMLALGFATVLWFAVGGELISRFEGGWRIGTLKLQRRPAAAVTVPKPVLPLAILPEPWADPKWFDAPSPSLEKISDPVLEARTT